MTAGRLTTSYTVSCYACYAALAIHAESRRDAHHELRLRGWTLHSGVGWYCPDCAAKGRKTR